MSKPLSETIAAVAIAVAKDDPSLIGPLTFEEIFFVVSHLMVRGYSVKFDRDDTIEKARWRIIEIAKRDLK